MQCEADLFRCRRYRADPIEKSPQIETAATQDQRLPLPIEYSLNDFQGQARKLTGREGLRCLENIDQMMRNALLLLERRLGRAQVKPAVRLQSVGTDDFALQVGRQLHTQRALADCCWTENGDRDRHGGISLHRCKAPVPEPQTAMLPWLSRQTQV